LHTQKGKKKGKKKRKKKGKKKKKKRRKKERKSLTCLSQVQSDLSSDKLKVEPPVDSCH
jgi:hypothetical protein